MAGPGVRIENLFHLLAYARNRLEVRDIVPVGILEGLAPWDFYAELLACCLHALRRRGLPRSYRVFEEDTRGPRGRILMAPTIARGARVRVTCAIDELTPDIPFNQLLKATARGLANRREVDPVRRAALRDHACFLGIVSDATVTQALVKHARQRRLDTLAAFAVDLCEMLHAAGLPNASSGGSSLRRLEENPQLMGWIFEDFVRVFLTRRQLYWKVRKPSIPWDLGDSERSFLPSMVGDVLLQSQDRRLLLEVKFTSPTLVEHHGRRAIRSAHLYQLCTYLEHLSRTRGPAPEGMLLYAQAEQALDLTWHLGGRSVRVCTLNLDQSWQRVEGDLLDRVKPMASALPGGPKSSQTRGLP